MGEAGFWTRKTPTSLARRKRSSSSTSTSKPGLLSRLRGPRLGHQISNPSINCASSISRASLPPKIVKAGMGHTCLRSRALTIFPATQPAILLVASLLGRNSACGKLPGRQFCLWRASLVVILLVGSFFGRNSVCTGDPGRNAACGGLLAAILFVVSILSRKSACGEHP